MPYRILLAKSAQRSYEKLPLKLKLGMDRALGNLHSDPFSGPNIEKLQGQTGCYRYRVGSWRILYEVNENEKSVRVYDIGSRGDVYKGKQRS